MNPLVLIALIAALQKEVILLEKELSMQQNAQAQTVPVTQNIGYSNPVYVPPAIKLNPLSILGSDTIAQTSTQPVPTLASNPLCQNPPNQTVADFCKSTSTDMCSYQKPSVEGGGVVPMTCVAIQFCSLEHDCP